jgi:uncharacterized YccA/Bax inhibitor family protein
VLFAAIMMIVLGIFGIFEGLAAIVKSGFYHVPPNYYISINARGWGWIHLIIGSIVVLAGFALFQGSAWARVVGIIMASLSAIANFLFIPFYPIWSLLIIAIDVVVIWALVAHGRALAQV